MGGVVVFVVIIGLAVVQLAAFGAGLHDWLGWPWYAAIGVGVVAFWLGSLGTLLIAVIGFFGAQSGWGWEWWQALLLCFPSLVLMIASVALTGVSSVGQLISRGRQGRDGA